jgi:hypothetical protein
VKEIVMSPYRVRAGLALLGFLVLTCIVLGGSEKKADPAAQDKEVIATKMTKQPSAASVNFRKAARTGGPSLTCASWRDILVLTHRKNNRASKQLSHARPSAGVTNQQSLGFLSDAATSGLEIVGDKLGKREK